LRLWIESARQSLVKAGEEVCGDVVRTFQTEGQFFVILASSPRGESPRSVGEGKTQATLTVDNAADMLERGASLDTVVEALLSTLPDGKRMPFSILQVRPIGTGIGATDRREDGPWGGRNAHQGVRARLVECDAPPLFLIRGGQLVLLPVLEDASHGHLVRRCRFPLQDGDRLVMVSQGYLHPWGWRWSWSDVAVAVRRWTDTGCDAEELAGALMRTYRRLNPAAPRQDVAVVAMHVRPRRTATVWTGPPADPAQDEVALEKLMAEQGTRIICGDTTAQIAARLLGVELELEPRPEDGADKRHPWAEVPPISRLEGMDLVTEGLVTLGKAQERMAAVKRVRDLPREKGGATCLARALLVADKIHFIVGLAINPAQVANTAGTIPLRRIVIDNLRRDLKARDKIVSVEYL
jgi:hypothetical protein